MNAGTPSPATDDIIITQIVIYTTKCIRIMFVVYQTVGAVRAFSHPPLPTSNLKTILLISTKWFKNANKNFFINLLDTEQFTYLPHHFNSLFKIYWRLLFVANPKQTNQRFSFIPTQPRDNLFIEVLRYNT